MLANAHIHIRVKIFAKIASGWFSLLTNLTFKSLNSFVGIPEYVVDSRQSNRSDDVIE